MVGSSIKHFKLEDVFTDEQVRAIINKIVKGGDEYGLEEVDVRSADDGLGGFLGDHLRATLHVARGALREKLQLFLKRLPFDNLPKMDFIKEFKFFKREATMCQLLEELQAPNDPHPWCVQALVSTDSLIAMPDLRPLGYRVLPQLQTLDLTHLQLTVSSVARFHAATANYEAKRTSDTNKPWTFSQEHSEILEEVSFKDSPWITASAKLTANILKIFSNKYNDVPDLEAKLNKLYVDACHSLKESDVTLNVLLHKDLWVKNIMFRYEEEEPVNAVLVDYQCLRYGPPAFDLMVLLYCATSRAFREQHEAEICKYYYSIFYDNLETATKQKLEKLGYNEEDLLRWCAKARMFGALVAIALFPYILMDPVTAKKTYDDPETYDELMWRDRTPPVAQYCRGNAGFRARLVEVFEEFVERYVVAS